VRTIGAEEQVSEVTAQPNVESITGRALHHPVHPQGVARIVQRFAAQLPSRLLHGEELRRVGFPQDHGIYVRVHCGQIGNESGFVRVPTGLVRAVPAARRRDGVRS
jgi:hypothetical protein